METDQGGLSQPSFWIPRPIPDELHSVYESGPFRKCSVCEHALCEEADGQSEEGQSANGEPPGMLYEIQKVYHGTEVIFEMALCHGCGETLCGELSAASLEALKGFLICRFTPSLTPHHCHFCGLPRALLDRFTLVGACRQEALVLPTIVLCDHCGDTLQEQISAETRETQEEFLRDHFPGLPGALDLNPSIGGMFA